MWPTLRVMEDEFEIRVLIENWVLWRDTADFDRLATVWHPEGRMVTTWCEASGREFVERSRKAWNAGLQVFHMLGGCSVEINGERAVAQTRMMIRQRAVVHGVLVDVSCYGRFCDAIQKHDGRWGIRFRQPVYELDTMAPVSPGPDPVLDAALLESFPEGYRNLGYLQTQIGLEVSRDLPTMRGPAVEGLRERMRRWLESDGESSLS